MNNIQYYHDIEGGRTYAVDVSFTKEDLLEIPHHFAKVFYLNVGISYLHPNDTYSKKVGRKISLDKIIRTRVKFDKFELVNNDTGYYSIASEGNDLLFTFRLHENSGKPYLIKIDDSI